MSIQNRCVNDTYTDFKNVLFQFDFHLGLMRSKLGKMREMFSDFDTSVYLFS